MINVQLLVGSEAMVEYLEVALGPPIPSITITMFYSDNVNKSILKKHDITNADWNPVENSPGVYGLWAPIAPPSASSGLESPYVCFIEIDGGSEGKLAESTPFTHLVDGDCKAWKLYDTKGGTYATSIDSIGYAQGTKCK